MLLSVLVGAWEGGPAIQSLWYIDTKWLACDGIMAVGFLSFDELFLWWTNQSNLGQSLYKVDSGGSMWLISLVDPIGQWGSFDGHHLLSCSVKDWTVVQPQQTLFSSFCFRTFLLCLIFPWLQLYNNDLFNLFNHLITLSIVLFGDFKFDLLQHLGYSYIFL